jgi:predicted DNA-binding antitoxin AbrB/MazE fold protein
MAGSKRIRALYEGGIFRPFAAVGLPDRAEVEITVVDRGGFNAWWCAHAERMHRRTGDASSQELDAEVDAAIGETREQRARRPVLPSEPKQ